MKSKRNTYLLLAAVLGIWGIIAYRFLSYAAPDEVANSRVAFAATPVPSYKKEDVPLDVRYRDPFLSKFYNTPAIASGTKGSAIYKPKPLPEPITWPSLKYKGIVSDRNEKRKVFMISINGVTLLLKEKTTEQGVTLISGDRKSVYVSYRGQKQKVNIGE